jgi:hypothetical protein
LVSLNWLKRQHSQKQMARCASLILPGIPPEVAKAENNSRRVRDSGIVGCGPRNAMWRITICGIPERLRLLSIQRLRQEWRSRRHPTDHRSRNSHRFHSDSRCRGTGQRHDPRRTRLSPRSDRVSATRIAALSEISIALIHPRLPANKERKVVLSPDFNSYVWMYIEMFPGGEQFHNKLFVSTIAMRMIGELGGRH